MEEALRGEAFVEEALRGEAFVEEEGLERGLA